MESQQVESSYDAPGLRAVMPNLDLGQCANYFSVPPHPYQFITDYQATSQRYTVRATDSVVKYATNERKPQNKVLSN